MKKKVMNIRPQEFTDGGERSVRYKGSDGKMHAMLPQNAAVPVAERTVIEAGTEITLAQAHEIEDFDFNKCSSLGFTKEFSVYEEISVNREEDGTNYLYLHYPGHENIYIKTDGSVYEPFSDTNEAELKSDFQYPYDDAKSFLAETLLAIAKQTGKLVIFHQNQSHEMVPGYYENAIVLTMAEDIVTGEEFFITKSSGEHMKIGLPKDAAVPVVHRSIIERGSEITLAQAHAIEGFDFDNCASLRFNEGFSPYASFLVNLEFSDNADSARFLEYSYPGNARVRFYKDGNYYPFQTSSQVPAIHDFPNDHQGAKEMLEQVLLEIAQQTGKLELYNLQGPSGEQFLVPYYEDAIILTIKNDLLLSEEFFMESFTGDLLKLPIGGGSTAPSNIVLEVNFADDGKAFTADELIAMITGIMAGKVLVCISDNNWGTQNERRIATLARVRGFEMADGVITIGNTLTFELSRPSAFGDLETVSFLKQNDGSYELSHYFNK